MLHPQGKPSPDPLQISSIRAQIYANFSITKTTACIFWRCALRPFFFFLYFPSFLLSLPFFIFIFLSLFIFFFGFPIAGFVFLDDFTSIRRPAILRHLLTGYIVNTYVRICARSCYNKVRVDFFSPSLGGWMPFYVLYIQLDRNKQFFSSSHSHLDSWLLALQ